jgi:hypothetical protein
MWILLFLTYALQPSRLIVRSGLDVPTFATRRLHACHQKSLKFRRLPPGANPRTWVPKASTLPLDHRNRLRWIWTRDKSPVQHQTTLYLQIYICCREEVVSRFTKNPAHFMKAVKQTELRCENSPAKRGDIRNAWCCVVSHRVSVQEQIALYFLRG